MDIYKLLNLDSPLVKEEWHGIKGWYKEANGHAIMYACIKIKRIMADWVALYKRLPTPGENTPVSVYPFAVDDSILEEEDIE